ncbi:o-succinylbenzoate--CoA ligase [Gordonia polyisoprenivorans]|uniref:o-succinylbenzoate--CoA ligase n=1 Tax=Gordonia polyisoprenivorans TaxID=84595 RepID=UPI00230190D4|nr:o-succinylbenzoate--CoA ligase [Gordonia polyisoprenivorans]WCB40040.1 o-succinylbenzoate--CoA ligase [Gordonia polyisoprenivorans]
MPSGPRVLDHLDDLRAILDGSAAFAPVPESDRESRILHDAFGIGSDVVDDVSLIIATSGSTGTPKGSQHTPATLAASARATADHLGGEGNWLLALPPHHIAGLQVLLRALAAGHIPAVLDLSAGFDPDAFADALDRFEGPRRYTSLVPTQLVKVLDSPRATAALADVDALLVGGAATPQPLLHKAIEAGIPIVRTYGMSETAGGCVYDGIPLHGMQITLDGASADGIGRVELTGPMVAQGYRLLPDHPAFATPGTFRTDDLGRVDDGVLRIIGRADEAISSGGLTILPQVVEAVIVEDPAVAECAVIGLPDARLGEKVVAVVVESDSGSVDAQRLRDAVTERLDRYAAPREVIVVAELPTRGPGKVDRRTLRTRLTPQT